MPNRILRDWTDSDRVNTLTADAERLFVRLIMKADDYGCYFSDAARLKPFLFPLLTQIRETDITRWLAECEKAGLVRFYEAEGKRFLEILEFRQRLRIMRRKYPEPKEMKKWQSDDRHMSVICPSHDGVNPNQNPNQNPKGSEDNAHTGDCSIPTWEEVKTEASMRGVPEESAKSFFDHHENNALWVNQFNRLIEWRRKLKTWAERDRLPHGKAPTSAGTPQPTIFALKTVMEAKEKLAKALFDRHASEGPTSTDWDSEAKRLEYVTLKKEIKELNRKIANGGT